MILVIEGTRRVAKSLSKEVGIGSRSHCLFLQFNLPVIVVPGLTVIVIAIQHSKALLYS